MSSRPQKKGDCVRCPWCEAWFTARRSDQRFCRSGCRIAFHNGNSAPPSRFKGGLVKLIDGDPDVRAAIRRAAK